VHVITRRNSDPPGYSSRILGVWVERALGHYGGATWRARGQYIYVFGLLLSLLYMYAPISPFLSPTTALTLRSRGAAVKRKMNGILFGAKLPFWKGKYCNESF